MAVPMQPVIEKLNFNNYLSWARDMKFLLDEKDLWEIVQGTEIKPKEDAASELKTYNSKCQAAMSCLIFNVSLN